MSIPIPTDDETADNADRLDPIPWRRPVLPTRIIAPIVPKAHVDSFSVPEAPRKFKTQCLCGPVARPRQDCDKCGWRPWKVKCTGAKDCPCWKCKRPTEVG